MLALPTIRRPCRARLRTALRGFAAGNAGIAAVEFAAILPAMLVMYFGVTEFSFGYGANRKLTLLSRSLADLTARATSVTGTDIGGIFEAAGMILQPYNKSQATMVLTSVTVTTVNGQPVGTVDWSCARLGPDSPFIKRPQGSRYPVPNGFENAASFILSETAYKYVPALTGRYATRPAGYMLKQSTPWPVRNSAAVTWKSGSCPQY